MLFKLNFIFRKSYLFTMDRYETLFSSLFNYHYLYNIDYEQIDSYNGTFENAKQIFNDNLIKIINYIELYLS